MYRQHCQTPSIKRVSSSQTPSEMNNLSISYIISLSTLVPISSLLFLSVFLMFPSLVSSSPKCSFQIPYICLCAPWVVEIILSNLVWPLPFAHLWWYRFLPFTLSWWFLPLLPLAQFWWFVLLPSRSSGGFLPYFDSWLIGSDALASLVTLLPSLSLSPCLVTEEALFLPVSIFVLLWSCFSSLS